MTVVEHNHDQHDQQQHSERPTTNRVDLARTDANRVAALVQIARDGHTEARDHGEDAERLQAAFFALYDRIASKVGDRRTRLDRALHGIDGSLDEQAVLEFLDLVGREGMTARQAQQQILDGRMFPEFDGGQEIVGRMHNLAHTWEREDRPREAQAAVRPALPPAPAAPAPQAQLPRRVPGAAMQPDGRIAPAEPPMFPKAPPETPVQQTGAIASRAVQALREAGKDMSASEAVLEASYGHGAPDFGPAADLRFAASALPQVRADDTHIMQSPFFGDDAADGENDAAPLPFSEAASTAANGSSPSGSAARSEDGDEA